MATDDIAELKTLLAIAKRPHVKSVLNSAITALEASLPPPPAATVSEEPVIEVGSDGAFYSATPAPAAATTSAASASASASAFSSSSKYVTVDKFLFDAGEYNSKLLSVYVELPGVGSVKDKITCSFTKASFDLIIPDLNGKSYRLFKDNLEHDISPDTSKFIVKQNKVVVKIGKVKGEFSYDNWTTLTAKKDKKSKAESKSDPSASIMDMMKNMYDEGDDSMKKVIGEAMMKSQRGEKMDKPDMNDMSDLDTF